MLTADIINEPALYEIKNKINDKRMSAAVCEKGKHLAGNGGEQRLPVGVQPAAGNASQQKKAEKRQQREIIRGRESGGHQSKPEKKRGIYRETRQQNTCGNGNNADNQHNGGWESAKYQPENHTKAQTV